MADALAQLRSNVNLRLTTAAELASAPSSTPRLPNSPPLPAGQVHEWFLADPLPAPLWQPPLTLLTALAGRALGDRRLVCIGRSCWPSFQLLCAALGEGRPSFKTFLQRTLFLDPLTDQERFWSIGQALRCPGIAVMIADASKLDPTTSRRLQLAAESGANVLGLLARPPRELEIPSWAATRWSVRSLPAPRPHWHIELLGCRGQHPGQDAPRRWNVDWTYQVFRGTGTLHFSAGVGHRAAGPPLPHSQTA